MTLALVLCTSLALQAPSPGCSGGDPAPVRTASTPAPSRGAHAMSMLSEKTLRACREPGVAIVLARVTKAEIEAPGTRSEMAVLDLAVERTICGEAPPALSAWRYTSRGDTILQEGERYVVVCSKGSGPVDYGLGDFVPVPPGREAEVVEAHLAAVKRMSGGGK